MNPYLSLCDDFGLFVHLNTKTELTKNRESILHFFESLRKAFPEMTDFESRENGEHVLEEDRDQGSHRWVALEPRRFVSGMMNPEELETADAFQERVLETAPFHLDLSPLDCDALDVVFAFDFLYAGNHDEVVAEALGISTSLEPLMNLPGSRILHYEPQLMLALDEACRLQCRLNIETRTNAYQVRTGQFPESPISVYLTIRQYWGRQGAKTYAESYTSQRKLLQEMAEQHIIPTVIKPLGEAIANRQ